MTIEALIVSIGIQKQTSASFLIDRRGLRAQIKVAAAPLSGVRL